MFKKILWLVFLFPLFLGGVNAETFYSDYRQVDEILEESDMVKKESEKLYRYYELKDTIEKRLYDGVEENNCENKIGSWQENKLNHVSVVDEEVKNTYKYIIANGARYIHLTNLNGSYGALRITELELFYKGNEIDYKYECNGCLEGFDKYIKNGIWNENESYIKNGGSLIIDLGNVYPVHLIDIVFYLFDLGNSTKTYTIGFSNNKKDIYSITNRELEFSDIHWSNAKQILENVYTLEKKDYRTTKETEEVIKNDYVMESIITKTKYRYTQKWCDYNKTVKEYYDDYFSEKPSETAIKDDEFISKDTYYYRDKLELKDNLIITSKEQQLNDFVLYSSTDYNLTSNADLNKNGKYTLFIETPYNKFNKDIIVDIKDNTIKEKQDEIDDLVKQIENITNDYEEKLDEINKKLNECSECKKLLEEKEKLLKNYEKELNDCKKNLDSKNNLIEKIKTNYELKLKELKDNNKAYLDKISELSKTVDKLNLELKNLVKKSNDSMNNCNNEITKLKYEKGKLEEIANSKDMTETKNEEKSFNPDYLLTITKEDVSKAWPWFLLIILISLLLIFKTSKNKSN